MKRLLLLTFMCCVSALSCLADHTWTDSDGVTWYYTIVNETNARIDGATNYESTSLNIPTEVYNGNTAYKVTRLYISYSYSKETSSFRKENIEDIFISSTDTLSLSAYFSDENFYRTTTIHVPAELLATYKSMNKWKEISRQIVPIGAQSDYDITVTAKDNTSSFYDAIGEDNLENVEKLKVTGTINGYDISYIRNKMYNLHHLDLTDATIVANDFNYYGNYHTEDSVLTPYAFSNLENLISVKLPKNLKGRIGEYSFNGCGNLNSIVIPDGVTSIGSYAFDNCYKKLDKIVLPQGITLIGNYAFYNCPLESIELPSSLKTIGSGAFWNAELTSIVLPESVEHIGEYAFDVNTLTDVYTTRFTPLSIPDNAFSNAANARLWVPYKKAKDGEKNDWDAVYRAYYDDAQWGKFASVNQWPDYVYEKISLGEGEDFEQDKGSAPTTDSTAADFGNKSGFINTSEDVQVLDTITVHGDGKDAASVIADGNINANGLNFNITVTSNRWYFFCFPFDIRLSDITCGGHYVFRHYDGSERAKGNTGWAELPEGDEYLHAGEGYIFQTDKPGSLILKVLKEKFGKFANDDKQLDLEGHEATDVENASWNFRGNPWLNYFGINDMDYKSPITYWDGSNYQTVRPGDDDYTLHPFEAFFVQKPDDVSSMTFGHEHRHTKNQSAAAEASAKAMRIKNGVNPTRLLNDLTLSDGKTSDKTRVVYNNKVKATYKIGTDAAKFSAAGSLSIYSLDSKNRHYAINERPDGAVSLGYTATKAGELTITASRMDTPLLLKDNETGTTFDLGNGSYTFETEAGTFNSRFTIIQNSKATGIADIQAKTGVKVTSADGGIYFNGTGDNSVNIYTLGGAQMTAGVRDGFVALPHGSYIVKVGKLTAKVLVK